MLLRAAAASLPADRLFSSCFASCQVVGFGSRPGIFFAIPACIAEGNFVEVKRKAFRWTITAATLGIRADDRMRQGDYLIDLVRIVGTTGVYPGQSGAEQGLAYASLDEQLGGGNVSGF